MKFTPAEAEILLHRLESGVVPEVMRETYGIDESSCELVIEVLTFKLKAGDDIDPRDDIAMLILQDAADGSTFFAGAEIAVANGEVSRGTILAYHKAANGLEHKLDVEVPRS